LERTGVDVRAELDIELIGNLHYETDLEQKELCDVLSDVAVYSLVDLLPQPGESRNRPVRNDRQPVALM